MNKENYAKAKKNECLERLKRTLNQDKGITEVFDYTFDRAYALGKQEKDSEEEEMLAISRREIQQLVAVNDKLIKKHPGRDSIEAIQAKTVNTILNRLFGSKCLPYNVDSSEPNVDSLEQKTAKPKFKAGDEVVWDKRIIAYVDEILNDGDYIIYSRVGNRYTVHESDLEFYTDPTDGTSPNVNHSDIDIDELVAKGYVPDPAKQFDTILKDSFTKERRLNIAAMAMQGLLASPVDANMQSKSVKYIVDASFEYADALISKSKEGGLNENN